MIKQCCLGEEKAQHRNKIWNGEWFLQGAAALREKVMKTPKSERWIRTPELNLKPSSELALDR